MTAEAFSQPVWHSPGAAPPSFAAFIAFAAFTALGATASGASFGVVTAPSASLSVVTAPALMFLVLTLAGFSFAVAYPTPPIAANRATNATMRAGLGRRARFL